MPTHISITPLAPSHVARPILSSFQDTACSFPLPCLCTYGSLGRVLFSSSQSSPPEGVPITRQACLLFCDCLSFRGNSGRGLRTREIRGPTTLPVKEHRYTYTHICPQRHRKRRACTVKTHFPCSQEKRREFFIFTTKWDCGGRTLTSLYWLIFANS